MKQSFICAIIALLSFCNVKTLAQINTFPYNEDFELGANGWTATSADTLTFWELGTPNYGVTTGANSGLNCWDINIDSTYFNNANVELFSPSFDFSSLNNPQISFWLNYKVENAFDGLELSYSTDSGISWVQLGSYLDTCSLNWYNQPYVYAFGNAGWTGESFGWEKSIYRANQLANVSNVRFKFTFKSDAYGLLDGISMDDFKIMENPIQEIELVSLTIPNPTTGLGGLLPTYYLNVRNVGAQTINSFKYYIYLNGSTFGSYLYTDSIEAGKSVSIPVSSTLLNQPYLNDLCVSLFLSGETDTLDNTICKSVTSVPLHEGKLLRTEVANNHVATSSTTCPIKLLVRNVGFNNLTNFNYGYKVNGVITNTSAFSGTINPGDSLLISLAGFNPVVDSAIVCTYINIIGELDITDNYNCTIIYEHPIYSLPFIDSFDYLNNYWYTEKLGDKYTDWELGTPNYGVTNSTHSGVNAWDINLNTNYFGEANCILYTPFFEFNNATDPKIGFWLNSQTEFGWDGLRLDYNDSTGIGWRTLGLYNDTLGSNWYNFHQIYSSYLPAWSSDTKGWKFAQYDLSHLGLTGSVQFRFVFTSDGTANAEGPSIDDFQIYIKTNNDAALTEVISPSTFPQIGAVGQVKVRLKNNGFLPLTNLNIKYKLNGGTEVPYSWTGLLNSNDSTIVQLPNLILNGGANNFEVYIDWSADEYHFNDTLKRVVSDTIFNIPYTTNFENGFDFWIPNNFDLITQSNWELGDPFTNNPTSTYSGRNCWDVDLEWGYYSKSNIKLTSPVFFVGQQSILNINFWMKYEVAQITDRLWLERTNDGINWNKLGILNDPNGSNWYNSNLGNAIAWSGYAPAWINSQLNFSNPPGNQYMQFRFVYYSDGNMGEAFSIDDFTISVITSLAEYNSSNTKILVYPNPAQTTLQVNIDQKYIGQNYSVLNQLGQSILTGAFKTELTALDISKLDAGIYVMKVGDAAIKFVKE